MAIKPIQSLEQRFPLLLRSAQFDPAIDHPTVCHQTSSRPDHVGSGWSDVRGV
ncbi:hypothetical protein QO001_006477 [Methylobacterium brachiatum]|uniref:Uncharacterized protein n=1 Tax=Methylobacterium brachiatum TaxID=269660 RepID=A0AAJ1U3R5_9HYPH|nr:hypothetical protein [Methylobacterium brachiatum]MCB4806487.1 hypothetical protein [Methylobacterium brachiatum]MDQ0547518.1 hypothetical protein [Methylobacterium brachiatum]